jgi:immunity protein Imm1 of predicted polymorphic toxin system
MIAMRGSVLNISVGGEWWHPTGRSETAALIDRIMRWQESWFPGFGIGGSVALCVTAEPYAAAAGSPWPDNYLQVGVNSFSGYGGLVWVGDGGCWVSDNPEPPGVDPFVLSNSGGPLSHHPRSTLPVARIRTVVEEFCRAANGERPTGVRWVPGGMSGERDDQDEERHHGTVTEPLRRAMVPDPARLRVLGAMRVRRMLPILDAANASFVAEMAEICEVRGRGLRRSLDGPVRALQRFHEYDPRPGEGPDNAGFRYARMAAVGIALAVAEPSEDPEARFDMLEYGTCAFWSVCHAAVGKTGAWEVATEMRDAEEAARRREIALLLHADGPQRAYRDEPRWDAGAAVRSAGWA